MASAWRWIGAACALAIAAWFTSTSLTEAYGAGAPYYSRTTNMDKWESPIPVVIAVDVLALALVLLALLPLMRRAKPR